MDRGAHFHRCDFQVHTPRDSNWSGPRPTDDESRATYARDLVAACRAIGLDAIAITDHHDLSFFPFVRAAAALEMDAGGTPIPKEQQLIVFPGMELTLAVPCQALLILDADLPEDRLSLVIEALAIPPCPIDQLPGPVERLEIHSFNDLYAELDKREWLRGRYIVLPNVSERGTSTLLRSGMANKYKEMPCVGAYVDGLVNQFGTGNLAITRGEDTNYGNKKVGVLQTSDNRTWQHTELGKATTWIKWATPSAEALRQACLADETRLSQTPPVLPTSYIQRLSVSNSQFLGPVELELNPQYNAIIGGRGTGKSTLLEYLRWALCDQPAAPAPEEDIGNQRLRRARLVEGTLASIPDAQVEVHFVINELPHVLRRFATSGDIDLKVGDQAFRRVSEADVRAIILIQAYSQKQLSSVAVRVDELTRFVTSPVQARLFEIEAELEEVAAEIRECYARLQRQRQLVASIRRDELGVQSLLEQATKLREGLSDVSEADRGLLEQRTQYETARQIVARLERAGARVGEEVSNLREFLERLLEEVRDFEPAGLPLADQLATIQRELERLLAELLKAATGAAREIAALGSGDAEYARALASWNEANATFDERYSQATARWSQHKQRVTELSDVEARQRSLSDSLAMAREQLRDLGDPEDRYGTLRDRWTALRQAHITVINEQCEALTALSDDAIRATVRAGSAVPELRDALRDAFSGSGVRATRLDAMMEALAQQPDPLTVWEAVISELELLAVFESSGTLAASVPPTPLVASLGLPPADAQRVAARLTTEAWLELSLTQFSDKPTFTYRSREDQYIPFENASAGQQATALLQVLLRQPGPPLIIDQPEDDLDSEIILAVAEQIGMAKSQRQLIFASHDANLVVNGDADLVVCCQYRVAGDHSGGRISHEGAIDMPEVREIITRVMEGGEKAFRLRTAKYGF
jgi:chromosome segregation protein